MGVFAGTLRKMPYLLVEEKIGRLKKGTILRWLTKVYRTKGYEENIDGLKACSKDTLVEIMCNEIYDPLPNRRQDYRK